MCQKFYVEYGYWLEVPTDTATDGPVDLKVYSRVI